MSSDKPPEMVIDAEIFAIAVEELQKIKNANLPEGLEQYTNWYSKYCSDYIMTESGRTKLDVRV